jgi:hypothetical protein
VIRSSGGGTWATRDYVDRLAVAWATQAARKRIPLDAARSVIILAALENREISVHPGADLDSRYGLREQTIDREIVRPHFIPFAKAGNYVEGLKVLVGEIEKWIDAKDEAVRREREAAVARAAEIRRNAEATLGSARELVTEARGELAAKQDSGLRLAGLASQVDQAEAKLTALAGQTEQNPQRVLQEAAAAQQQVRQALDELRRLAALQTEAAARFERLDESLGELEGKTEQLGKAGLAVDPVQAKLDAAAEALATARGTVRTDPQQSLAAAQQVAERLQAAERQLAELPGQRRQVQEKLKAVEELQRAVSSRLDHPALSGTASHKAALSALENLSKAVSVAKAEQASDYDTAFQQLSAAESRLQEMQESANARIARHTFLTRTLPVTAALIALAVAAAVLAWLASRYLRRRRAAEREFEQFKLQVVALLDRLDAIKKRHQLLPFSDRDYTEPMAGNTLALYQAIDENIGRLRARWLELMDLRQRGERLLATHRLLATRPLDEVRRLLAESGKLAPVDESYDRSMADLDRLEQAHERAEPLLKSVDEALGRVREQLARIDEGGLPTAPYEADLQSCVELSDRGRSSLRADPLGAFELLSQSLEKITLLGRWTEQVLQHLEGARQAADKLNEVEQTARQRRAEGLKLTEEQGNPDPVLAEGRAQRETALAALARGNLEQAAAHLEQAFAAAAAAAEAIERQHAAKAWATEQVVLRRDEMARLRGLLDHSRAAQEELARDFAAASWRGVADNLQQADQLLAGFDPAIDEAARAAADEVQAYFRAADLLQQTAEDQQQAAALIEAVARQREELSRLREQCRQQRQTASGQLRQIQTYLAQHEISIRDEARALLVEAERELETLAAAMEQPRPDWTDLHQQLAQAAAGLESARARAEDDVRCHQALLARLDEVRRQSARIGELLSGSTADRPRANQAYQAASLAVEQVAHECGLPRGDWPALTRRLDSAAADLESAERFAREDIRLAQQAAAAVQSAQRQIEQARSYYSLGISADVSPAERQLAQVQASWSGQGYEQVIQLAAAAERAAREAYHEAVQEVERKQRRIEAERRRREEAQRAAAQALVISTLSRTARAGGFGSSGSPGFGSSSRSSSSSPTGGSRSSSSSWGSSSSQSRW